jgi:hypothetical protein
VRVRERAHPAPRFDSARPKGASAAILTAFGKLEGDILLGTQMIAGATSTASRWSASVRRGSLHLPDFAPPSAFRRSSRFSGARGTGQHPGRVIVTRAPEHRACRAARHDYAFARTNWRSARPRLPAVRPARRVRFRGRRRVAGSPRHTRPRPGQTRSPPTRRRRRSAERPRPACSTCSARRPVRWPACAEARWLTPRTATRAPPRRRPPDRRDRRERRRAPAPRVLFSPTSTRTML